MTETIHASDKYLILFNAYCAFIRSICDWLLCREPSIACVGQWLMMGLSVLRWLMSSADHRRCRFIRLPLRRLDFARSWHNIDLYRFRFICNCKTALLWIHCRPSHFRILFCASPICGFDWCLLLLIGLQIDRWWGDYRTPPFRCFAISAAKGDAI